MSGTAEFDWDPGTYHRFRGHRLRPALDLLRAVPPLSEGGIADLGCGSGAAGPALAQLNRPLTGVDKSEAMLAQARHCGVYGRLDQADIAGWAPDEKLALIYSNAALHWVPDHAALLPRLAGYLVPGGVLAIQMPHQNNAPSHRLWRDLAEELFPEAMAERLPQPGVLLPAEYHRLLLPLGQVSLWETEYYQDLAPDGEGHPVRRFTEATYARPILARLNDSQRATLIATYERVIDKAYPAHDDGRVLFPLRRLFITLAV
ncbi:methyltransferase domain-containing protein [Aestuariicoccus sp. MJ-SS9]|uniref:methyltransferase domain-containing protein n=1 Tax=Aestuariicoccus sp. MJ-SS9 TaxID=3079855 RepID=UPI00290788CB|nr:methyltransferase domain-containing protein [Aestuariicoccus sp. MJ-SS9]MDU8910415.1 methyltransferase domain-containing protein [Aestuariicoccus sp. MJ-SS9]